MCAIVTYGHTHGLPTQQENSILKRSWNEQRLTYFMAKSKILNSFTTFTIVIS